MFKTFIKAINRLIDERKVSRGVQTSLKVIGEPLVHSIYKYEKQSKTGIHFCILLWTDVDFKTKINWVIRIKRQSGIDSAVIYDAKKFKHSGRCSQIMKTSVMVYYP